MQNSQLSISITNPCNEPWELMQDIPNGKFCNSCKKEVIDFTKFSNSEIIEYYKNYGGTGCGKFLSHQLSPNIIYLDTISENSSINSFKLFLLALLICFGAQLFNTQVSYSQNYIDTINKLAIDSIQANNKELIDTVPIAETLVNSDSCVDADSNKLVIHTTDFDLNKIIPFDISQIVTITNGGFYMDPIQYLKFPTIAFDTNIFKIVTFIPDSSKLKTQNKTKSNNDKIVHAKVPSKPIIPIPPYNFDMVNTESISIKKLMK